MKKKSKGTTQTDNSIEPEGAKLPEQQPSGQDTEHSDPNSVTPEQYKAILQDYHRWLNEWAEGNETIVIGDAIDLLVTAEAEAEAEGEPSGRTRLPYPSHRMLLRYRTRGTARRIRYLDETIEPDNPESPPRDDEIEVITRTADGREWRSWEWSNPDADENVSPFRKYRLRVMSWDPADIGMITEPDGTQRVNLKRFLAKAAQENYPIPEALAHLVTKKTCDSDKTRTQISILTPSDAVKYAKERIDSLLTEEDYPREAIHAWMNREREAGRLKYCRDERDRIVAYDKASLDKCTDEKVKRLLNKIERKAKKERSKPRTRM